MWRNYAGGRQPSDVSTQRDVGTWRIPTTSDLPLEVRQVLDLQVATVATLVYCDDVSRAACAFRREHLARRGAGIRMHSDE